MGRERKVRDRGPLPSIDRLAERHIGLTEAVARYFNECVGVCFHRHQAGPTSLVIRAPETYSRRDLSWTPPDERTQRAHANRDDATRDAAYGVSIAAVEAELGWIATQRAETRTGADYYIAPADKADDLEAAHRLEVSGTDRGDEGEIRRRLSQKVQQTKDGDAEGPALAVVVGFAAARIAMERVEG